MYGSRWSRRSYGARPSSEAQVRGVVRDASGGLVTGAKVTITDAATNISSSIVTDDRGSYIFNGFVPERIL